MRLVVALASGCAAGQADVAAALAGLKGETEIDCVKFCKAAYGVTDGRWTREGSGTSDTWKLCKCDGTEIKVYCDRVGGQFTQCCENECASDICSGKPSGWSCPAAGVCGIGPCQGDWRQWIDAHNTYRCMHDVPGVAWSGPVYTDAHSHFKDMKTMVHSDSYHLAPPAGPAGENLYHTSGTGTPEGATADWYDEVTHCKWPGCAESTNSEEVGHFTALIWDGVQTIGCGLNEYGLGYCRYKALDYKSCKTPNMDGDYDANVFQAGRRSEAQCKGLAQACAVGAAEAEASANDFHFDTQLVDVLL